MTTVTQIMYFTDDDIDDMVWIYSGTQGNSVLIVQAVTDGPFVSVGPGHSPLLQSASKRLPMPLVGVYGFLDFFLSLAMDTAILPLTIGEEVFEMTRDAEESRIP